MGGARYPVPRGGRRLLVELEDLEWPLLALGRQRALGLSRLLDQLDEPLLHLVVPSEDDGARVGLRVAQLLEVGDERREPCVREPPWGRC